MKRTCLCDNFLCGGTIGHVKIVVTVNFFGMELPAWLRQQTSTSTHIISNKLIKIFTCEND